MGTIFIVVMGVSGSGKSTLAAALAKELDMPLYDADDLHPKSNVAKMSRGEPLSDADREPWLELLRSTAERVSAEQQALNSGKELKGVVMACSALKRYYRDILRGTGKSSVVSSRLEIPHPRTYFVYISGNRELLLERMNSRKGHFMKTNMLDSQLQTLEIPEGEERVITVRLEDSTEEQLRIIKESLSSSLKVFNGVL